jgi:hypothetical protein
MIPSPIPTATRKKVVAPLISGPSNGARKKAITAKRTGNINFFIIKVTSFHFIFILNENKTKQKRIIQIVWLSINDL